MGTIDVRIPTYQRPALLRRALKSLVDQDYPRFVGTVFDDDPLGGAEPVVRQLNDPRVSYVRNAARLGAAANIDKCFKMRAISHSDWSLVLEDDNFLLPGCLRHIAEVMRMTGAKLALFNQRIADSAGELRPESETTRGCWFHEGWVDAQQLHASTLLMEGISNGGLVWRTDSGIRLAVGSSLNFTSLHEACRSLLIETRFWFSEEALAVWSNLPRDATARHQEENRIVGRGQQSITRFVLKSYGWPGAIRALSFVDSPPRKEQLISRLLHAGALLTALRIDPKGALSKLPLFFKGLVARLAVNDPCRTFFREMASRRTE